MSGQTPPNQRFLVVYNPKSGKGDNLVLVCADHLREAGATVETRELEKDSRIEDFLKDAEDFSAVVAAGGDGTVSSVAYALRFRNVPLLAYPAGTANLIAQNLDLPEDPRSLAELLLTGNAVKVDLGELEVDGQTQGFAMLAGAGADAAMIRDSEELKGRFGALAYVMSAMKQVNPKKTTFTLRHDGQEQRVEAIGVMVANFGMANYRLPISSDISPSDGKFTVVIIKAATLVQLLPNLLNSLRAKLNLGDPLFGGVLDTFEAREITVDAAEPFPLQYDGELHTEHTPFSARVLPGAIRFITPSDSQALNT